MSHMSLDALLDTSLRDFALVTVGTTSFRHLISHLNSEEVAEELCALLAEKFAVGRLVVQKGSGEDSTDRLEVAARTKGIQVYVVDYTQRLTDIMSRCRLVISHGGSGTVLEVLRKGIPLVVVLNESLMDNHQKELGDGLMSGGYLHSTNVAQLLPLLRDAAFSEFRAFPSDNEDSLRALWRGVDAAMGCSQR